MQPQALPTAEALVWACELDVQAFKPGNVSLASPGHGMQADQFIQSARAAAPCVAQAGWGVGHRIEQGMLASLSAAGCNTNLGIVLLAAPIAAALERAPRLDETTLQALLEEVLATLTLEDARAAYRAIARTQPGGLGQAPQQDVHQVPSVPLREAMAMAAHRDSIARQYAQGYLDLFELGLPAFEQAMVLGAGPAMQRVYVELLCAWPDSHIVRKHGEAAAHTVMQQALPWRERLRAGELVSADAAWAAWDAQLKAQGLNPGTSADLAVATALLWRLLQVH
jgi:triphosphoribosyl-dephospho-CoA synthase